MHSNRLRLALFLITPYIQAFPPKDLLAAKLYDDSHV